MAEREPGDLKRLGDLLGDTYADLAGEGDQGRAVGGSDKRRAAGDRTAGDRTAGDRTAGDRTAGDLMAGSGAGRETSTPRYAQSTGPERALVLVWPEVVGAELAANARPVQLRGKRLVVSSASSAWAQTLQFMAPAIAAALNERLGATVVEQIVFRHAGWRAGRPGDPTHSGSSEVERSAGEDRAPGARRTQASAPLTADQEAALAEVQSLDLAPELRERIIRAMRAAFVRGEQDSVR